MTNVYIYGELKNKFGGEFSFQLNSAKEAFSAINANRRGFLDEVKRLAIKGVLYRIVVDDVIVENVKELDIKKAPKEVHLIPIVWGAGKGGAGAALMIVAGIALIAVTGGFGAGLAIGAFSAGGALAGAATAVGMIGAAIAVQGVMSLLFPQPKPDFNQEVAAGGKSYLFGTKPSNTSQGQAVPVGYGRLLIGSSQVSLGITHHPLKTDIKTLMTPVDRPIDDLSVLEFIDEPETAAKKGVTLDSFYTNQSAGFNDSLSFSSVNILNSYINIITTSAAQVSSEPVEVVVTTNGETVSNPNLTTFDEDITYTWNYIGPESDKDKIKIEHPYAFDAGVVYRIYNPNNFLQYNNFGNVANSSSSFFVSYPANTIIKFGPTQFKNLNFGAYDPTYGYVSGELVSGVTGANGTVYFQCIANHTGQNITGAGPVLNSAYWRQITCPETEENFRSLYANTGHLPTGYGTASDRWELQSSPLSAASFDTLTNYFGKYEREGVYSDIIEATNQNTVGNSIAGNNDNYMMEFLGYIHIPIVQNRVKNVKYCDAGTMYEIIKVGDTGQWSGIGLTGAGGAAIAPVAGMTFIKNSTQATGDGKVYPVVKYKFKIDSDDAADLYIDGQVASTFYGGHGFQNPSSSAAIDAMPSTTNETLLTLGYHRIYARFQDGRGSDGLSIYYQYDSNWDGGYSNFVVVPKTALTHRPATDFGIREDVKFLSKNQLIPAANMVAGRKYKIITLGAVSNWNAVGASSPVVGSVFVKNSTAISGTGGYVFEDTFSFYQSNSAQSNRIVAFSAQRPKNLDVSDPGLSLFRSKYQCAVTLNGETLTTSPVKINIRFLPTETAFNGVVPAKLTVDTARQR